MKTNIENQTAFVTGSNRGIGRAIVEGLLQRGVAKVYAAARNTDTLSQLVAENPDRVIPVELDVTNEAQVNAAAKTAESASIVINNAGNLGDAPLFDGELSEFRKEFEVNYWGPLFVTRAFAPVLKANGGGTLVTISSVAGLSSFPVLPTYSDSKAAVHSLIVGTRFTLAEQGTTVIGVYPGPVDTEMAKNIEMEKASPESVASKILDGIENGTEDIFPDSMSESYTAPYEAGQKTLERNVTEMLTQPA